MRRTQDLIRLFRDLLQLVEDEAARNSGFGERLDAIYAKLPIKRSSADRNKTRSLERLPAPDVFQEWDARGENEFGFWLRSLELPILKAIVKQNGFDPGKNTVRWTEPDKFVSLIREQMAARLRRGNAFLPPREPPASS